MHKYCQAEIGILLLKRFFFLIYYEFMNSHTKFRLSKIEIV